MAIVCFECGDDAVVQCELCKRWVCNEHAEAGLLRNPHLRVCSEHAETLKAERATQDQILQEQERKKQELLRLGEEYRAKRDELVQYCQDVLMPKVVDIWERSKCRQCNGGGGGYVKIKRKSEGGSKPSRYQFTTEEVYKDAIQIWRFGRVWEEYTGMKAEIDAMTKADRGEWRNTDQVYNPCPGCHDMDWKAVYDKRRREVEDLARRHKDVVRVVVDQRGLYGEYAEPLNQPDLHEFYETVPGDTNRSIIFSVRVGNPPV